MKEVTFSVNQRDEDGDVFDTCVLIHIGEDIILRFKNYDEYFTFVCDLNNIRSQVKEVWKLYNEEELL